MSNTDLAPATGWGADNVEAYDLPIRDLTRITLWGGYSLGATGLFSSACMVMLDRRAPLPADDAHASRLLRLHKLSYVASLKECLGGGCLIRLPDERVWAPIIAKAKPIKARRARQSVSARGAIPPSTRETVLAKTGGLCAYCCIELTVESGHSNSYEPDHVLPVSRGGADDIANLIPSCFSCNRKKKNKPFLGFIGRGD